MIKLPDGRLVTITLVEIRGDKARIGVEAPHDVPVHRMEVWNAIQREGSVDES